MKEKTILYIEDNFHNRRIVRKILGTRGYTVIEAEDGLVGYEMIRKLKPPLVLLDIALPHLDGIQIVQRLKADSEMKHIPVIALTASAMRGDRERFLEAGCDEYLSKPVRANELIEMVDKFFETEEEPIKKEKKKSTAKVKVAQASSAGENVQETVEAAEKLAVESKSEAPLQTITAEEIAAEVAETKTQAADSVKEKPAKAKSKKKTTKAKTSAKKKTTKATTAKRKDSEKPKKEPQIVKSEEAFEELISNNVADMFMDVSSKLPSPDVSPEPIETVAETGSQVNGNGTATVWVMDDNSGDSRLLRRVMGAKLKVDAIEISTTTDFFAASEKTPDVILYGVRRPDDKMYQVLNTIRTQANIAEVPIFLLSTEGFNDSDKAGVAKFVDLAWSKERMLHVDLLTNISNTLARILAKKKAGNVVEVHPESAPAPYVPRDKTVLVIEDIADSAALAAKILTRNNYKALTADSGEAGLAQALEHKPDMILLDLGLPDVDGQTLLGFIRDEPSLKGIPVIVCTAWPKDSLKEIVKSYGFDGYISKPYKVAEFMDVVKEFTS